MGLLSILDTVLFGVRRVFSNGVELPERPAIAFAGEGVTVVDDVANNRTTITVSPAVGAVPETRKIEGSDGIQVSPAPGTLDQDLVIILDGINDDQHGERGGDTLHSPATEFANGFMSSADKVKLDAIGEGGAGTARYWVDTAVADAAIPNAVTTRAMTAKLELVGTACVPLGVRRIDEAATTTIDVLELVADASGAGLAGYGSAVLARVKGAAALQDAVRVAVALTNVGAGSEASEVSIATRTGGAALRKTFTATPAGVRLAYEGGVYARNEADGADVNLIRLAAGDFSSDNAVIIGADGGPTGGIEYHAPPETVHRFVVDGVEVMVISFGKIAFSGLTQHVASTVAGLSAYPAADYQDCSIIVTNETGGRTIATSDGTNWRRVSDGAIVS